MDKLFAVLRTKPLFPFLLPVFFIFHTFTQISHYAVILEALQLLGIYLLTAVLLIVLFLPVFKNYYKACVISFLLLSFNFFFGSLHDFSKNNFGDTFFLRYSFILPCILLVFIALIIYLKKSKKTFRRAGFYLNCLLLVLLIIDFVMFIPTFLKPPIQYTADLSRQITPCYNCNKPDIYLIIADEYAGSTELKEIFSFDNSSFEDKLKARGFHVANQTTSNYNATVYSMASMFSMDYIHKLEKSIINHRDMFICRDIIKKNNLTHFLRKYGYQVSSFSPFGFADKKNYVVSTFFVSKKELFTAQTFINRIRKEIGYHFISQKALKAEKDKHLHNNNKIEDAVRSAVKEKATHPKFIYSHFALPHFPYYFDSLGNKTTFNTIVNGYPKEKKDYIQYLVYANKRLLNLIDTILADSKQPPVIILMSDHGYRQFTTPVDTKYHFMNLNAILTPQKDYTGFYDGMSNVNQFRVLLNTIFKQKLPLCKDSTIYLSE